MQCKIMNIFLLSSYFVLLSVIYCDDSLEKCGSQTIPPKPMGKRIIGGTEAKHGSWPWMVMLTLNGNYKCGGSILTTRFILTAAHCVFGQNPNQLKVIVGKHHKTTTDDTEEAFAVEDLKVHGRYNSTTLVHDIAILKLQEDLTYSENVRPVCLPNDSITFQGRCYTIGWGDTRGTGHEGVLKQLLLPKVNCQRTRNFLPGNNFCAGSTVNDACSGDSGGPYNCQHDGHWYVAGVVSHGKDCAQPLHPGIYVKVSKYRRWIEHIMSTL